MPRPPQISRTQVLQAALTLVDEEGLDGLTMRKVGLALGVEAMSLYRHVSNKQAVLDGVLEAVLLGIRLPRKTDDWKKDVRALAEAFRGALLAHPNTLPLFAQQPAVTLASLDYVEFALGVLSTPVAAMKQRIYALQALVSFVIGHVISWSGKSTETRVDYSKLTPEAYPCLHQVGSQGFRRGERAEFRFGVELLLNGLERYQETTRNNGKG